MTNDYKTMNSNKETRSYYTIQDSNFLAKENYKANGMDHTSSLGFTHGSGDNHGCER